MAQARCHRRTVLSLRTSISRQPTVRSFCRRDSPEAQGAPRQQPPLRSPLASGARRTLAGAGQKRIESGHSSHRVLNLISSPPSARAGRGSEPPPDGRCPVTTSPDPVTRTETSQALQNPRAADRDHPTVLGTRPSSISLMPTSPAERKSAGGTISGPATDRPASGFARSIRTAGARCTSSKCSSRQSVGVVVASTVTVPTLGASVTRAANEWQRSIPLTALTTSRLPPRSELARNHAAGRAPGGAPPRPRPSSFEETPQLMTPSTLADAAAAKAQRRNNRWTDARTALLTIQATVRRTGAPAATQLALGPVLLTVRTSPRHA